MKKIMMIVLILAMVIPVSLQAMDNDSSIESYSTGTNIKGDCVAKYVELSDDLKGNLVVKDKGLGFIDNEDFLINVNYPIKYFEVIDDLDNDRIKDVVLYVETNRGYSNFLIVSSKDSKVLYELALTHQNYNEQKGVFIENSIIRQIVCDKEYVYLIYDHHLLKINAKKKSIVYNHEEEDNIWKLVLIDNQVIFTTQLGQLVSLDDDGNINYRKSISKPIKVNSMEKNHLVDINLWDLLVFNDKLYVSCENDKLYEVDYHNGEVINDLKLDIVAQDDLVKRLKEQYSYDYVNSKETIAITGVFSKAFNGYKLKQIKDDLMLVEAYLGDQNYQQIEMYGASNTGIEPSLLLISDDFEVVSKIKLEKYNLDCSNAVLSTYQGQEAIIIPSSFNKDVLRISVYSLDGKLLSQNDIKNLGIGLDNIKVSFSKYNDDYLLQINNGNSYIVHNELKTVSFLGSSRIVNKIADVDDGVIISSNQNGKVNEICKLGLNGKDDVLAKVDVSNKYMNNGFEAITYDDNSGQLLSLVNEINNKNEVIASHIVIIDINSGKILQDRKVSLESNKYLVGSEIKYFSDLNGDEKKEILVDNCIIDGNSFDLKSYFDPMIEENGTIIEVGDLNNDKIVDYVNVGESEMRVYHSMHNNFDISYSKTNIAKKYDKNLLNNQHVKVIGDLEHDGVNLFIINARNSEGYQYYQVINPKDLSVRFNLLEDGVYNYGETFILPKIDFNQDGCDDLIFNNPSGSTVDLLSGKDGKVLQTVKLNPDSDDNSMSAVVYEEIIPIQFSEDKMIYQLEDINDDSVKELGYFYYDYYKDINNFKILDGKNYEQLKNCSLENIEYPNNYAIPVLHQTKILINDGEYNQIYDYKKGQLVAGIKLEVTKARAMNDERILMENNGQLYAFDDSCDFKLVDFNKNSNGKMKIKYQSDKNGQMSVYDQGKLVTVSNDKDISLKLLEGKHKLTFSYNDNEGKITHINKVVEVEKSSVSRYLIILCTLIVFGGCLSLVVYPKYRLKKGSVKYGKVN